MSDNSNLSPSAKRVQDALGSAGIELQVRELSSSTRTAEDAAASIGCDVGQIVKSLIFRGKTSGDTFLLLVSGSNRVDLARVSAVIGEKLEKADADYVRERTGFAIGGVPPVGYTDTIRSFVDRDLLAYSQIWAAAGTPRAVFALTPSELVRLTAAQEIAVT